MSVSYLGNNLFPLHNDIDLTCEFSSVRKFLMMFCDVIMVQTNNSFCENISEHLRRHRLLGGRLDMERLPPGTIEFRSIPSRIKPMTSKLLDASLLDAQH